MKRETGRNIARLAVGVLVVLLAMPAAAAVKPRVVVVVPFDASTLPRDEQWIGEGVAQILRLGLVQHPVVTELDQTRLRAVEAPTWSEVQVIQIARTFKVDHAVFGQVLRTGGELVLRPRLLEVKASGIETLNLEPVVVPEGELLGRMAILPLAYIRSLRVTPTEAEAARIDKAARPTRSVRAFELYTRSQMSLRRNGQEARESAADLLSRAIETDPSFAVAQYVLGTVHLALGNRWKAAAQFRASTQLDPAYPEPYKALGDLFLSAPRRLFDQAIEAYSKAIELRPFYADAHVGLGDARAAKGDVDGAIAGYQRALTFDPVNARVYLSLGKIYYTEKGLYYEAVGAYKKAIDFDPRSVEARMGLGEVYEDKGLYKEAIEEYRKVIDLDGKHTGALYNLAAVYEKVDPREAIVQWERYIALASGLPSEKDWVDVARQHLRKLRNQLKD
jgi:tetratricopeptide (TPR) repeat protein/TolB-like protein